MSTSFSITTNSPDQTKQLGERLGKLLKVGSVLGLVGELGSGKTVFVKGIALSKGIDGKVVTSPTFVLMNSYEGAPPIRHYDCYRLDNADEILNLGYWDFIKDSIIIIEWADKIKAPLGEILLVEFKVSGTNSRELTFSTSSLIFTSLLEKFQFSQRQK